MKTMDKAADLSTAAIRSIFTQMGLDPSTVIEAMPHEPDRENRCLRGMLRWATAYRRFGSRQAMEKNGFLFPPVQPGYDQDSDWLQFENWMAGKQTTWTYAGEFPAPPNPAGLSDEAVAREYALMVQRLATRSILVGLAEGVPVRKRYEYLRHEVLSEPFDHMPRGTTTQIDGCTGNCDTCFQQPWCEMAAEFQEA